MYTYPIPHVYIPPQTLSPEGSVADDFLDALLGGSDSSSAPASPLWSPCTTDSGINEDPLTDPTENPHPSSCTAFPVFDATAFPQPPPLENQLPPNEQQTTDVSIDLSKTRFTVAVTRWHFVLARNICEIYSHRVNHETVSTNVRL